MNNKIDQRDLTHYELKEQVPKLPVPTLEQTLTKYLDTVRSLVNEEAYDETKNRVEAFVKGTPDEKDTISQGKLLQEELLKLSNEVETSYIEGFWDTGYLEYQTPLPQVNPYFLLVDDTFRHTQNERAAHMIRYTALYARRLIHGEIKQTYERNTPLCMSQYRWIFQTRVPSSSGRDRKIRTVHSDYIIVLYKNHFYRLNLVDDRTGHVKSEYYFKKELEHIKNHPSNRSKGEGVGILTTMKRTDWAKARNQLMADSPRNRYSIDWIDNALFILVLDPRDTNTMHEKQVCMAHGGISEINNRWFDKLQLIISNNGTAMFSMEHSSIDADTLAAYMIQMVQHGKDNAPLTPSQDDVRYIETLINENPLAWKLKWDLTRPGLKYMKKATLRAEGWVRSLQLTSQHFQDFGSRRIKSLGVSPDGFIQMAFQLTYYLLFNRTVSVYESINTKRFFHGRTETCRSSSWAAAQFVHAFVDINESRSSKVNKLREACEQHKVLIKEAKAGFGVDRHLLALQLLALQRVQQYPNYAMPSIFTDLAYSRMKTDILSTSSIPSSNIQTGGFAPVVSEGFGISYLPTHDSIFFMISNYEGRAEIFIEVLARTLNSMAVLLTPPKGKL